MSVQLRLTYETNRQLQSERSASYGLLVRSSLS